MAELWWTVGFAIFCVIGWFVSYHIGRDNGIRESKFDSYKSGIKVGFDQGYTQCKKDFLKKIKKREKKERKLRKKSNFWKTGVGVIECTASEQLQLLSDSSLESLFSQRG